MPIPLKAPDVLNREFLQIRAKILEIAATLDRLDRADGSVADDPRMEKIQQAIGILECGDLNRAEQVQMLFSRPFDEDWQQTFARQGWSKSEPRVGKPK